MFGHKNCEDNFSDLHTMLEAQMILENLCNDQADNVAKQITEILSLLASNASKQSNETNTEKLDTAHQNSFAERLKFALKEQGMTQADLAREADVSQSFISMCVNEKVTNPKKIYIELLATALNVDFEWLMNGEGSIYGSVFLTNSNKA
ncbi:helix-turn-helix domain-containing protein [Providencia stuartii]|uniref:helix-turn-helix domain-containing protein n=1 Tax=Providencia stuartii TaxID=588 RepID=UPI0011204E71|nr:helix-turn-helix transcriptional regulator [Providencia stuartii]